MSDALLELLEWLFATKNNVPFFKKSEDWRADDRTGVKCTLNTAAAGDHHNKPADR